MIYPLLVALAIPLVLIAAFLPPALLAGKVAEYYDLIPEDIKHQYGLSPQPRHFTVFDLIGYVFAFIVFLPIDRLEAIRAIIFIILVAGLAVRSFSRAIHFFRISMLKDCIPTALIRYSRFAGWGKLLASLGALAILALVLTTKINDV